jgi:hypothetical protein
MTKYCSGPDSLKALALFILCAAVCSPICAQESGAAKEQSKTGGQSEAEMAMMAEMGKPGPNHKLLADGVGTWNYTVKFWMDPSGPPMESTGVAVVKAIMDGRFFVGDHSGKMQMPGPDGKMVDMEFKGMGIEGYDNAKKKFISSWVDNMGTGIMNSEGDYDAGTKTITYRAEFSPIPGVKTRIRETVQLEDKDHHKFQMYEDRGGKEVKTVEITYTRQR